MNPFSCADFSFPKAPHEMALDLIAGLGFDGVDLSLMASYSHVPVAEVLREPARWAEVVASKLRARGLRLLDVNFVPGMSGFGDLAVNHPDAAVRCAAADAFQRALEFATNAGAAHMTMLPGIAWEGESADASLARSAGELAWRVSEAAAAGVTLSVEAHLGSVAPTPPAALELLRRTPGLTLTLDYTHFICQGLTDADCEPLMPHATHFHARCACPGRLQCGLRANTINYPGVIAAMRRAAYRGAFALEYVWMDWQGANDVDILTETVLLRDLARQAFRGA